VESAAFLVCRRSTVSAKGQRNAIPGYRIGVDELSPRMKLWCAVLAVHAYRWVGVCGAAEMLDGTVALVLDLPQLIENASGDEA
jgi:hypothetical protein